MSRDKKTSRQARYRAKKARLELVVSDEIKELFKTLPGMEGLNNAQKLQTLCNHWLTSYQGKQVNRVPVHGQMTIEAALASLEAIENDLEADF